MRILDYDLTSLLWIQIILGCVLLRDSTFGVQSDFKAWSFAKSTLDTNGATHLFYDLFNDGEAKSSSRFVEVLVLFEPSEVNEEVV